MFNFVKAPLVLATLLFGAMPAFAGSQDVTVRSGKANPIDMIAVANEFTCHTPGKPTMFVSKPPAHGKITFSWVQTQFGDQMPNCKGKAIKGMLIVYTPAGGYRGADSATISYSYPTYEGSNTTSGNSNAYRLNVK